MLVIKGTFIHSVDMKLEIITDKYMTVRDGVIESISSEKPGGEYEFIETSPSQFLMPGLIDGHLHAPQYAFAGCGLDLQLLEWLNTYTFPAESKFADIEWARKIYETIVTKTIANGTTTASYFATIHEPASNVLFDICLEKGQRAFIGKVSMDRNSPDFYVENTKLAIQSENSFVDKHNDQNSLVQPIITPRFVPSCTSELMLGLSDIQKRRPDLLVQSHVSENEGEIAWVKELHPDCKNYTDVYQRHGLLSSKTILAHGVHLTDEELTELAKTGASVIHCPASNFQLFSGACDVQRLLSHGVNVGLGTDVAGGPSPSLIESMRNAIMCSRTNQFIQKSHGQQYKSLMAPDVFALATEGSAKALGIFNKVGNFIVGKEFDAVLVDMNVGGCDCFGTESKHDVFDKFVHRADDRNILRVYVQGKRIK